MSFEIQREFEKGFCDAADGVDAGFERDLVDAGGPNDTLKLARRREAGESRAQTRRAVPKATSKSPQTLHRDLAHANNVKKLAPEIAERVTSELSRTHVAEMAKLPRATQRDIVSSFDRGEYGTLREALTGADRSADPAPRVPAKPAKHVKHASFDPRELEKKANYHLGKVLAACTELFESDAGKQRLAREYTFRLSSLIEGKEG